MRRGWIAAAALAAVLLTGCGEDGPQVVRTYKASESNVVRGYSEMDDGTWRVGEVYYQYRLELSGKFGTSGGTVTVTVLTNQPDLRYEDVSGSLVSFDAGGAPDPDGYVVVEMR
ncbi:MAG: hypothetical protein IJ055_04895 [Oscillospiraceae bacterium]|nr:hypothetical protein [Oscillospiraceae bacterium]